MVELLTRMGYEGVTRTTRRCRKGKHADAGFDLLAYRLVPGGRRKVVVQCKQYPPRQTIYRNTVDQLVGAARRAGGAEGLLLTSSSFAKNVMEEDYASAPILPVQLIDGAYLADLLALYRLGVEKVPAEPAGTALRLNRGYFDDLRKRFKGPGRAANRRLARVIVTVTTQAG